MQSLLSHGADVNMRDADGRSTLYVLALENRLAMARFLVEEGGADIESRDSEVGLGFWKPKVKFLVTYSFTYVGNLLVIQLCV